jgi:nucleotide-binding universal stress UspA family protein
MALVQAKIERTESAIHDRVPLPKSSVISVKNVLFATDFSATSEAAVPYAAAICRHFSSSLHTVHVLSDASLLLMHGGVDYVSMGTIYEDAHTEVKEKLDQLSESFEGIPHRNYVRHGRVWKNLSAIVEENDIDLIVLGTHGRTGLGKLLLGSVAEDILRHAKCPVLTVGPKVSGRAKLPAFPHGNRDLAPLELELREIVCATNFAPNADRVAQEAVALAAEFSARLSMMHVIEDYEGLRERPGPIDDAARRLKELVSAGAALQYAPETVLDYGNPAECILKVASAREADMIILGARSSLDVGTTHSPWSSAHHVIAHAHCPVLTIRE